MSIESLKKRVDRKIAADRRNLSEQKRLLDENVGFEEAAEKYEFHRGRLSALNVVRGMLDREKQ